MAVRHLQRCFLAFVLAAAAAGCGGQEVPVVEARREAIEEVFTEPAQTRQPKARQVNMPLDGRIERIGLDPGDRVEAGQILVEFDAAPYRLAMEEAQAAVKQFQAQLAVHDSDDIEETVLKAAQAFAEATKEALRASTAEKEAEQARMDRAAKHLDRIRRLVGEGDVPESDLDDAELAFDTARIAVRRQEFMEKAVQAFYAASQLGPTTVRQHIALKRTQRQVIEKQLAHAEARLARARHDMRLARVEAPVDGVVLQRFTRGEGAFAAGAPLIEIGRPADMEVVAEVLTQDALRLKPGGRVQLDPGIGMDALVGRVQRIEPSAFTKRSALGVEQQKVNVVIDLDEAPPNLGVGYRLHARFIVDRKDAALVLPRFSVLEAPDGTHYVFKVAEGRLARQEVTLGLKGELAVEIESGLAEGDVVARFPDVDMEPGQRVRPAERNRL